MVRVLWEEYFEGCDRSVSSRRQSKMYSILWVFRAERKAYDEKTSEAH